MWGAELPQPRDDNVPQPSLWRPLEGKVEKGGLKKSGGYFSSRRLTTDIFCFSCLSHINYQ